MKTYQHIRNHSFVYGVMLLCLSYLVFELFFNAYAMFSVDEFWFEHLIYRYQHALPYRDFAPYKTVLGYYLLMPPLWLSHGVITPLIVTRDMLALLNTGILFGAALWLTRYFSKQAVLISLALLATSDIVLTYSTNIRVDLLAYWFCFFSLFLLLDRRYLMAGLLIGLGFITSQKAIWYLAASNVAFMTTWLASTRDTKQLKNLARFNLSAFALIALYVIFWACIAGVHTVMSSVFYEASVMYHLDFYNSARKEFWYAIVLENPLLFLLWPLTLISTVVTYNHDKSYLNRLFVVAYASTILVCLIPYKQIFPYYTQVTIPAFFALYAAFFTWLMGVFTNKPTLRLVIEDKYITSYVSAYLFATIGVIFYLHLPLAYLLICLIAFYLGAYVCNFHSIYKRQTKFIFNIIGITVAFMGLIYPMTLYIGKVACLNGEYQKETALVANDLLENGETYVAGMELVYNKPQIVPGMKHLMLPAVKYLYEPNPNLRTVMLSSLDQDPNASISTVIQSLKKMPVKFYVNNYRMRAIPQQLKLFLNSQYEHLWGSIYIYAPEIPAGTNAFNIKFTGTYLIESNSLYTVSINDQKYYVNSTIHLTTGAYISNASEDYRLKLMPANLSEKLNPAYQQDQWRRFG